MADDISSGLDRRTILGGAAALLGAAAAPELPARAPKKEGGAPPFLWGTAGAAYQIEGGNVASDLWLLEHRAPQLFKDPSGDACDTYHRIEEDLDLVKMLGFNAHRLSLEWSRIEPEPGQFSTASLDYYRRVLLMCRDRGLVPLVTFSHWSLPRWFAERGAFRSREGVAPFADFCRRVAEHMADLIGLAATLNEANFRDQLDWSPSYARLKPLLERAQANVAAAANAKSFASPIYADPATQPFMIEAHTRAYAAIKEVRPDLPIGVTLALTDDQPAGDDSGIARKFAETCEPWLRVDADWIGVQTYTRALVGPTANLPPEAGAELTQAGYEFWPEALENVIRKVAPIAKKPIYVTENGIGTADDTRRVGYIRRAVTGVERCIAEGIDVRGYLHWSLLDNWEWNYGYSRQFGLVSVDRKTFKRSPKPSAFYLGKIARNGGLAKRR